MTPSSLWASLQTGSLPGATFFSVEPRGAPRGAGARPYRPGASRRCRTKDGQRTDGGRTEDGRRTDGGRMEDGRRTEVLVSNNGLYSPNNQVKIYNINGAQPTLYCTLFQKPGGSPEHYK